MSLVEDEESNEPYIDHDSTRCTATECDGMPQRQINQFIKQ